MNTSDIVSEIDAEISRLQQVKPILTGTHKIIKRKPGRPAAPTSSSQATKLDRKNLPAKPNAVRTLSAEARAKIAAAQKARWAKSKKATAKEASNSAAEPAAKKTAAKGVAPKTASAKKSVSLKKVGR